MHWASRRRLSFRAAAPDGQAVDVFFPFALLVSMSSIVVS
jgi:hypothetical protein